MRSLPPGRLRTFRRLRSDLNLDLDTRRQLQFHERVDGFGRGAVNVQYPLEGGELELLACLLVDERRTVYRKNLLLGRQRYRTAHHGARSGSILSPLFPGGGRVFGPVPRDYSFKLNKKLKRLARRSALSYKMKDEAIKVVEDFAIEAPRTKTIVAMMNGLKVSDKKILVVLPESNRNILLSARNLQNVKVIPAANLNTYDVMNASSVLIAEGAVNVINEMLA